MKSWFVNPHGDLLPVVAWQSIQILAKSPQGISLAGDHTLKPQHCSIGCPEY